jgi:hypothetical protein
MATSASRNRSGRGQGWLDRAGTSAISIHARLVWVVIAVFVAAGMFVTGLLWAQITEGEKGRRYDHAIEAARSLKEENDRLRSRIESITADLARADRQIQIDKVAYDELTESLDVSESYITELREELRFYRSIISPEDSDAGVRVHDFSVSPLPEQSGFRYKLVLVQALKHDREVSGTVNIEIEGERGGQTERLPLTEIGDPPGAMSFRYFQRFSGDVRLPDAFVPRRVLVSVKPRPTQGGPEPLDKWIAWNVTELE